MQKQETYAVTGGAGFIGTNLVESLVSDGHQVHVIDTLVGGDKDRLPEDVQFHEVDVRDTNAIIDIFSHVDVVVHLAALPRVQYSIEKPISTHDVNVNGTLSVLEACRATNVRRLVYAASSSAYGDQETLPLNTSLPAEPKSPYALQKYMGEQASRLWSDLYGVETVSLRFFNVYGPHLDPEGPYALVIGKFLKQLQEGTPLTVTGDGEQTRDFTHVFDVVAAVRSSIQSPQVGKGEVLNVGYGEQTSINDLAKLIGGLVEYIAARHEPRHTLADISETKALLDWEPKIDLKTGIMALKEDFSKTSE